MRSYSGRKPVLGWSLHMTGGWRAKHERVKRWFNRAVCATEPIDRIDFLYAFFENAYHLRDWIKDTKAVEDDDLNKFISGNAYMRLCRDLANSHKHYSLNRGNSTPPSEVREYSPGNGNLELDTSLIIIRDGTKYDAVDLAKNIMTAWEDFIKLHFQE